LSKAGRKRGEQGDQERSATSGDDADEVRAKFAAKFHAAVRRRSPNKIREMAKQAGTERWIEAARPLADFLVPPSAHWRAPRKGRREWAEARAAAVWALGQIGYPPGIGALAHTLVCDPDFTVRAAAGAAVGLAESSAVPSLVGVLRSRVDWQLDGMCSLLAGLGRIEGLSEPDRRAVGMALIDVLYSGVPTAPLRWTRPAVKLSRVCSLAVMIALTVASQHDGAPLIAALLFAWMAGQAFGFGVRIAGSVILTEVRSRAERQTLHATAAQSIIRLNDKRAIPGMLRLAFDTPVRSAGQQARRVLLSLLPQVTQDDVNRFSPMDIELLNVAVGISAVSELTVAVLHTLEMVGNGSSIRRVQRVVRRARSREVHAAATRALQALEAREARMKMSQSLLRGAAAPPAPGGEMLRAAMPQVHHAPEQLLRPTHGEQPG
jgi:hypothetical protein